jgi:hypothetical protein
VSCCHVRHTLRIDIDTVAFVLRDGTCDWVEKLGRMNDKALRRVIGDGADRGRHIFPAILVIMLIIQEVGVGDENCRSIHYCLL